MLERSGETLDAQWKNENGNLLYSFEKHTHPETGYESAHDSI
jgi:hypothetical protein